MRARPRADSSCIWAQAQTTTFYGHTELTLINDVDIVLAIAMNGTTGHLGMIDNHPTVSRLWNEWPEE